MTPLGAVSHRYELMIVICPSDGDVNPNVPLVLFNKNRLIPGPGFSFTHPRLIFITDTLYHNTINTIMLITRIFLYIQVHITAMWPAELVHKQKVGHKSGPQTPKVRIIRINTPITLLEKDPTFYFFLRKPGGFQWSTLAWGDLKPSYSCVNLSRLSIASVDGMQYLNEVVFIVLVEFSL